MSGCCRCGRFGIVSKSEFNSATVFNIITGTADRVGGYVYTNGRSNELGFGRVNACQAVLEAYRVGN